MSSTMFVPSDPSDLDTLANDLLAVSPSAQSYVKNVAAFQAVYLKPLRNTEYKVPMTGPLSVLQNGFADCGHKEWLFQSLLGKLKLKCRRVSFSISSSK